MSSKLHLTLATGDYESIRALKEGYVRPDGIELTVLTDMTSDTRHWRMLRNREFDIAELSMSNYLMATYTGLPFTAISGVFASPFSPWIYFFKHEQGHQEAGRPDRQECRSQKFSGDGERMDPRCSGARARTASPQRALVQAR